MTIYCNHKPLGNAYSGVPTKRIMNLVGQIKRCYFWLSIAWHKNHYEIAVNLYQSDQWELLATSADYSQAQRFFMAAYLDLCEKYKIEAFADESPVQYVTGTLLCR
jgi:hypothetical protein